MPPIKHLIESDRSFYGGLVPKQNSDPVNTLENSALPPNPMSRVPLTNTYQQNIAVNKLSNDLDTNTNLDSKVKPPAISSELNQKDTNKYDSQKEISGFSKFIDNPLNIDNDKTFETEARLQGRDIVGFDSKTGPNLDGVRQIKNDLIDKPSEVVVDTLSEFTKNSFNFVENKMIQAVMLIGGIYIASIVVNNITKKSNKED
tara:strand:+ start:166 stop:771 length:606 start_codon:yes stop_codon:yes gene_type:complete